MRAVILYCALLIAGCATAKSAQPEGVPMVKVIVTSPEMKAAEAKFTLDEGKAYSLLIEANRADAHFTVGRMPICIVGDDYVFGIAKKVGYPLRGYYVNGFTGAITYKDDPRTVDKSQEIHSYTPVVPEHN